MNYSIMAITFMFSGQGSQYVGMCQELYQTYDCVQKRFEEASNIVGYDVAEIMFHDEVMIHQTAYTQPLMFVMYVSILDVLKQHGVSSTHTCGLSLGEYGAYYDAGVITFEQGLLLLQARGQYMQEACDQTEGLMSAILGMDADVLEKLISQEDGYVTIANYNTYGQLVISGESSAVQSINEKAIANGAKRAMTLQTSGPFHSQLMNDAKIKFSAFIRDFDLQEPTKKLLVNTTGTYATNMFKDIMSEQITNSVMFYQMIETLLNDDVTTFVEIGPKKTLTSFVKKIDKRVTLCNIEDLKSLQTTLEKLEENNGI